MGSCAHFMNSERFRNLFGPTVDDCYWTDVSGLHASSNFRTIYLGISNNFWCGFWVNGQLLDCFCLLIIRLNVGSLAFFISCTCLRTGLLSGGRKQMWCICDYTGLETYIGSTENSVFLREQSRTRKYRQHALQQLAFFEPAIKLWHRRERQLLPILYFSCPFSMWGRWKSLEFAWALNKHYNKHCGLSTTGSLGSTSWCVYGLTMGAYFKFCCCIDERVQLFQVYPMLLSQPYFAHCYVDNRAHQEIFRFAR